jgi:3-phosphoshikimate 1-carboxyvinyltransferase
MEPVIRAIESLGPRVEAPVKAGYLPVEITSEGIRGGEVTVDARESSQFLSALLLVAPSAAGDMRVCWTEPAASFPYVEITLAMMREAGIRFTREEGAAIAIPAPQRFPGRQSVVEGDFSSASYFWAAAAVTGGEVFTGPLFPESRQGDRGLLEVLERMGCRTEWTGDGVRVFGPEALEAIDVDMNRMPDMVPTLAVVAAFAKGTTRIRNVAHLRIKESDRLGVMAQELSKFGAPVRETPDGLVIEGGHMRSPEEAVFAHDDHRIAMTFAVAGLKVPGVSIEGAEAVSKSYPTFWEHLEALYG